VYLASSEPFSSQPADTVLRDPTVFSVQFRSAGKPSIWVKNRTTGGQSYLTSLNILAIGAMLEINTVVAGDTLPLPDTVRAGETTQVLIRVRDANGDTVVAAHVQASVVRGSGRMLDPMPLHTDDLGFTTAHFLCAPSPASEQDSIRVSSGDADTVFGIYVSHLSDSLFAFPNPFGSINRDQTLISYSLQRATSVKVTIYDPFGNEVWTRHYDQNEPGGKSGDNTVYWDGTNTKGQRVASGIYVIQVLGTLHTGIDFRSLYRVGVVW